MKLFGAWEGQRTISEHDKQHYRAFSSHAGNSLGKKSVVSRAAKAQASLNIGGELKMDFSELVAKFGNQELLDVLLKIKRGYDLKFMSMYDDEMIQNVEMLSSWYDTLIEIVVKAELFDRNSPASVDKEASKIIATLLTAAVAPEPSPVSVKKTGIPAVAKIMMELDIAHLPYSEVARIRDVITNGGNDADTSLPLSTTDGGVLFDLRKISKREEAQVQHELMKEGFSVDFSRLIAHCANIGATAVRFDEACDEFIPGFKMYDHFTEADLEEGNWPFREAIAATSKI